MDFDDLDDAIDQRFQEGGEMTEAELQLLSSNQVFDYVPTDYMPRCPRTIATPGLQEMPQETQDALGEQPPEICLRAFFFLGPGQTVASVMPAICAAPAWIEIVAHEWPGHGVRSGEAPCKDLDALVEDAIAGIKPSIDQMKEGGELQGAPFAMIGFSIGAQILVRVAKKLRFDFKVEPAAVVVLDRAAPDVPMFSEEGERLLKSDPKELVKAYSPEVFAAAESGAEAGVKWLETWIKDLDCACDTAAAGFHKFQCNVLAVRSTAMKRVDEDARAGQDFREITLKLADKGETLLIPVQTGMKVKEVRAAIAGCFAAKADEVVLMSKDGAQEDGQEVADHVTVKGIKSFREPAYSWPHPVGIIGTGYNGIKTAMEFARTGRDNYVLFDRNDLVGGYCWITAANTYSKLQTEFGSFHIWWGPEFAATGMCGGLTPDEYEAHAKKPQVLAHMRRAAEEYGILPNCQMQTNVSKIQVVGGKDKHDRYYKLSVDALKEGATSFVSPVSLMFCYPGSMTKNRIVDYPGEDAFDGQIAYGMGSEFKYDDGAVRDRTVAILGNGAFAVENVRTAVEHDAKKVYLVTRRKNLASPRIPCWFCHQGPIPTPGALVLRMFQPMYSLTGMGDPFSYHAVHANKAQTNVNIIQNSRFGIGDVTFLCVAYGKCEYVEDTLKRVSKHTLHLTSGRVLEDVTGIIKSLGLLGDFEVDKLHNMDKIVGKFCDGDWRRFLTIDATGMNAANFTTFSLGIGVHNQVRMLTYIYDFPFEFYAAANHETAPLLQSLPSNKARLAEDKPSYVTDVKYDQSAAMILSQYFPEVDGKMMVASYMYKHHMYHTYHPTKKFLEYCIADWDRYQQKFKEQGCDHEYIEYPYTMSMIDGYFHEFNELAKFPGGITIDGTGCDTDKEKYWKQAVDDILEVKRSKVPGMMRHLLFEKFKGDPYKLALARRVHAGRDKITVSSAGSARDFDDGHFNQWSDWTFKEAQFADVEASSDAMLLDGKTWELVIPFLENAKAPPPA